MTRTRALTLALIVCLGASLPARAELRNVFVGPGRYIEGAMSKLGVITYFKGYVDTGVGAGTIDGEPYVEPLVEAVWGIVYVRKGTVSKRVEGLYSVTIDRTLGTAALSGTIDGVSINVTMTATGYAGVSPFAPDPNALTLPSFALGLDVPRPALVTGGVSASGVGGITGGTGAGTIGSTTGVYVYYV